MKKKDKIANSLKIYPVPKEDAERGKKPFQKLKPYLVLQYLLKETDEAHVADSATIIKYLNDIGIYAERRSIYKDVEVINQVMWLLEKTKKRMSLAWKMPKRQSQKIMMKKKNSLSMIKTEKDIMCGSGITI